MYVPPSEKQQPAYTGIARWNELSFWQKRKRIPGTESSSSFFFLSFDHTPESQEASELFVGLSHITALTFQCLLTVYYLSLIYLNGMDFLKTV